MTNFERIKQNITVEDVSSVMVQARVINNAGDFVYFGPDNVEFDCYDEAIDHINNWLNQEECISHN